VTSSEQTLPLRHQKLLAALLTAHSVAAAAEAAGVSERHVYRCLKDAQFSAALREARREALKLATISLSAAAGEAIEALREIVADDSQPAGARVSAAAKILDTAFKSAELEDLEERLAAVEERLAASAGGMNGCRTGGAW
jgi:hypothetical protein